jgi:hypothetical protein
LKQVVPGPTAVGTSDGRDGTKSTAVTATFRNLEVTTVKGSRKNSLSFRGHQKTGGFYTESFRIPLLKVGEERRQTSKRTGANKEVHFGHGVSQFAAITLGQTACHHKELTLSSLLGLGQFQNGINGFLSGTLDKTASVYHDKPGLQRILYWLVAAIDESAQNDLAVNPILRATQALEIKGCRLHAVQFL